MMYTIDLLKGKGIPIRHRRGGTLIIAATIAVPVIVGMILYTWFMLLSINYERTQVSRRDCDAKIKKADSAVKAQASLAQGNATMQTCLVDVSSSIGRNVQWSPIIGLVVENMPSSTVLNRLDVSLVTQSKQVPDKQDATKLINVPQTLRKFQISLFEYSKSDNGEGVRQFISKLRTSKILADKVEDIRIAMQERDKVEGVEVTRYDIECVFKPQS